jgi:hypothetical protein
VKRPRQPLFLARDSYRRRRAMDVVRLLPFLGLFLMMLPLLWMDGAGTGEATAREGLYLFGVWAGLILAAAFLARRLAVGDEAGPPGAAGAAASRGGAGGTDAPQLRRSGERHPD